MTAPSARLTIPVLAAAVLAFPFAGAAQPKAGPKLVHTVFFALKNRSPEARDRFIASCHRHLANHEGVSFFAVGTIADSDNKRPALDQNFDVSLHMIFASKEDEAAFLAHPRRHEFVKETRPNIAKVRMFDTYIKPP